MKKSDCEALDPASSDSASLSRRTPWRSARQQSPPTAPGLAGLRRRWATSLRSSGEPPVRRVLHLHPSRARRAHTGSSAATISVARITIGSPAPAVAEAAPVSAASNLLAGARPQEEHTDENQHPHQNQHYQSEQSHPVIVRRSHLRPRMSGLHSGCGACQCDSPGRSRIRRCYSRRRPRKPVPLIESARRGLIPMTGIPVRGDVTTNRAIGARHS
jgi:hypothetical protein